MQPSSSSSSSTPSSSVIDTLFTSLTRKGWCFNHINDVIPLLDSQFSTRGNVDSLESELLNLDLRLIGGKSLPESSALRKASHYLQGPKVLQVSSVRDISRSDTSESSGSSNNHRLLSLKLTDGHTEVTAIEYSPVPSISEDIVPGTKVRLENKAVMHYGILCLNSKTISILGGVVQSLYEEWQTNRKYAGFSRSSIRQSNESSSEGPPAFEKLQVGAKHQQLNQPRKFTQSAGPSSRNSVSAPAGKQDSSSSVPMDRLQSCSAAANDSGNNLKLPSNIGKTEEKSATSEVRLKEVVESIPVQNQAAAQKLLQKMTQPNHADHRSRFRRHRGQEQEEDSQLLTLDEWEKRKTGGQRPAAPEVPNLSQDEDLARQLQMQFDLEDVHVQQGNPGSEAEHIRMSMFSFERDEDGPHGGSGFRGRGRGRGGRRGRGRGRGRNY